MTAIKSTIFENAEAWLTENMSDLYTDGVSSVHRLKKFNPEGLTPYHDYEEEFDVTKNFTMKEHVTALRKMVRLIDGKKLFVGGVKAAVDLTDAGNWDAEVVDAFNQLIYHGEVIYG